MLSISPIHIYTRLSTSGMQGVRQGGTCAPGLHSCLSKHKGNGSLSGSGMKALKLHNAAPCYNVLMNTRNKHKRNYRKITASTIALHQAQAAISGNGTAAVEILEDGYANPGDRAYRIQKKAEGVSTMDYIENSLQQIGAEAVQELGELIHSEDEHVRAKMVTYAIDHLRGKAVQKSISVSKRYNVQSVLD